MMPSFPGLFLLPIGMEPNAAFRLACRSPLWWWYLYNCASASANWRLGITKRQAASCQLSITLPLSPQQQIADSWIQCNLERPDLQWAHIVTVPQGFFKLWNWKRLSQREAAKQQAAGQNENGINLDNIFKLVQTAVYIVIVLCGISLE